MLGVNTPDPKLLEKYENLKDEVRHHRRAYYVEDNPEISDAAFDALFRELEDMEALNPQIVTGDSPTQEVGGDAVFSPVEHLTQDRKSTRLNSSHVAISYAVFCLKKKNKN